MSDQALNIPKELSNPAIYSVLYKDAQEALLLLDIEGIVLDVNDATCVIFDREDEALVGNQLLPFVHEEDQEVLRMAIDSWRRGFYQPRDELRFHHKPTTKYEWSGEILNEKTGLLLVKVRDKTPDLLREEILIQHTITLNDLNKFNIALLNGEFAESSLRAVVDKMREMTGAKFVGICRYDDVNRVLKVAEVSQTRPYFEMAAKITRRNLYEMKWKPPAEWYDWVSKQKVHRMEGTYEITFGNIPRPLCRLVDLTIGIGSAYGLVFGQNNELYGTGFLLLPRKSAPLPMSILQVYTNIITSFFFREQKAKEDAEYREQLQAMTSELALSEESERRRIAQALHDDVVQDIGLVRMKLKNCLAQDVKECRSTLRDVEEALGECIDATRSVVFKLSPPVLHEIGLLAALEWLADHMSEQYGSSYQVHADSVNLKLLLELRVTLFQIARELCVNAGKHAQASQVNLRLSRCDNECSLEVSDDGIGLVAEGGKADARNTGYGLFSIRERIERLGGSFTLDSESGKGTSAKIMIPDIVKYLCSDEGG